MINTHKCNTMLVGINIPTNIFKHTSKLNVSFLYNIGTSCYTFVDIGVTMGLAFL